MATFEERLRGDFQARLVSHIAAEYPQRFQELGEAGTTRLVLAGLDKAAAHNVTAAGAVAVLIELMVEVGSDFERSPDRKWAQTMLAHPTLPGHLKIEVIQHRIRSRTQGRPIVIHRRGAS